MKTIQEIAKEQGIDMITTSNIDDILFDTKEANILISRRHMGIIIIYFLANFKEIYPKEFVTQICENGWIDRLYGIRFINSNE